MAWVSELNNLDKQPHSNMKLWLTRPYELSPILRKVCQRFQLKILSQGYGLPLQEERDKLSLPNSYPEQIYIREVELWGDEIPLTYGRVTIPEHTYQSEAALFDALGENPIGETILYHYPDIQRSGFEFGYLSDRQCWGRRSVFWMKGNPLLITEGFYENLPPYPEE